MFRGGPGAPAYDAAPRQLRRPRGETLKDLRQLFATALSNAGLPEPYRQYLMGHAPSNAAAIGSYTHLNQVREQYLAAVGRELSPLLIVLRRRAAAAAEPKLLAPPAARPPVGAPDRSL